MDRRVVWLVGGLLAFLFIVARLIHAVVFYVRTGDPMILLFGALGPILLANTVLIVGALAHLVMRDDLGDRQRLLWGVIVVLLTPVVAAGAIAYLALGRERTAALFRDV